MQFPLRSSKPVALVGGGRLKRADFSHATRIADFIVAADGGAAAALACGRVPDAVIGDLDSLAKSDVSLIPSQRLFRVAEQETTDFCKCVTHVQAPLYIAVGFTGGRLDHELANFNVLARFAAKSIILVGENEICFALRTSFEIDLPPKTHFSLFPFTDVSGTGRGLKWPFDRMKFSPAGRIGTSNEAIGGPVELEFSVPGMLAIMPRQLLDQVAEAILDRNFAATD
ncbi:MAG: thiamine diphosphokinase [Albidovulum sp.]|nr:thiamine diphosphokinase [Albidovulum sp.]